MRTEIDPVTFAVSIFGEGENIPFLFQPSYPNMDTFDSVDEANLWANTFILSMNDPTAPEAPIGRGITGQPRMAPPA